MSQQTINRHIFKSRLHILSSKHGAFGIENPVHIQICRIIPMRPQAIGKLTAIFPFTMIDFHTPGTISLNNQLCNSPMSTIMIMWRHSFPLPHLQVVSLAKLLVSLLQVSRFRFQHDDWVPAIDPLYSIEIKDIIQEYSIPLGNRAHAVI